MLAVQFVLHEANKNIFPSEEVLILIAQNLAKSKDVQNLALLRSSLPVQTSAGDKIYEYELTQRLAEIHQVIYSNIDFIDIARIIQRQWFTKSPSCNRYYKTFWEEI